MVSPDTTRMLVLGVAQLFEPANGYQLRRELLSWRVESWASVNPGSIYSMLSTLSRQGMLERHDLAAKVGVRSTAVYTMTAAGQKELRDLVVAGIEKVAPFDQTALYAALSLFVGLFERPAALDLLRRRRVLLDASVESTLREVKVLHDTEQSPPHVLPLVQLGQSIYEAERDWLDRFIDTVTAGELLFKGEPGIEAWTPLPDDPAWEMVSERAAYRAQIRNS